MARRTAVITAEDVVRDWLQAKAIYEDAQRVLADAADAALEALEAEGGSIVIEDEDEEIKVTAVQSTMTVYDEAAIEEALGPRLWSRVTKRKLDTSQGGKLEQALARKEVGIETVLAHSEVKDKAPYLKATRKKVR